MLVFSSYEWVCHCGLLEPAGAVIELDGASASIGKGNERTPTAMVMDVMGLWGWGLSAGHES